LIKLITTVEIAFSVIFAVTSIHLIVVNLSKVHKLKTGKMPARIKLGFVIFTLGAILLPVANYFGGLHEDSLLVVLGLLLIATGIRVRGKELYAQMLLNTPFHNTCTLLVSLYSILAVYILNGAKEGSVIRDWAVVTYYRVSAWLMVVYHALSFLSAYPLLISLTHVTAWLFALYPSIVVFEYTRRWM